MLWFHLMFIGGCSTSIDLIWKVITLQTLWFISFGVFTPVPHGCQDWSILMPFWLKIDQSISFISAPTTPTLFFPGWGDPHNLPVRVHIVWSYEWLFWRDGWDFIALIPSCLSGRMWREGHYQQIPLVLLLGKRLIELMHCWFIFDWWFRFVWPICQIFRSFISSWCIARWIFYLWFDIILADQPVVRFCTPNLPTSLGVKNRGPLHWGVSMWSHAFCKNLIDIYIYIYI